MSSSRSSSKATRRTEIGRVRGHRGPHGEMTLSVHPDDLELWTGLERVWDPRTEAWFAVEAVRGYGDRLVLKLAGVDDAGTAAEWRGRRLEADRAELPEPGEGEWWNEDLVGLRLEAGGRTVGTVDGIVPTSGRSLLRVLNETGREVLVPLVKDWLVEIDTEGGALRMTLPDGLIDLNEEAPTGREDG